MPKRYLLCFSALSIKRLTITHYYINELPGSGPLCHCLLILYSQEWHELRKTLVFCVPLLISGKPQQGV